MGYRIDKTSGVATGEMNQTIYMVTRGDHINSGCCASPAASHPKKHARLIYIYITIYFMRVCLFIACCRLLHPSSQQPTNLLHFAGFDYGNAEADNDDDGQGTMQALYFGNSSGWGHGQGQGPWVMADLENGLWAGEHKASAAPSLDYTYVPVMRASKL